MSISDGGYSILIDVQLFDVQNGLYLIGKKGYLEGLLVAGLLYPPSEQQLTFRAPFTYQMIAKLIILIHAC